jgi:hypothetical protein
MASFVNFLASFEKNRKISRLHAVPSEHFGCEVVTMILHFVFLFVLKITDFLDNVAFRLFSRSWINGTSKEIIEAHRHFNKSAHILDIIWKNKLNTVESVKFNNFMVKHNSYADPVKTVAQDDNVSLISICQDFALFAYFHQGLSIYDTKHGPFLYNVQYENVIKIITVPLKFIPELSKHVKDVPSNIILLSNTGRCGSTILTKMLETNNDTVVMSEPDFLVHLLDLKDKINIDNLVNPGFSLQCKGLGSNKTVIIKPRSAAVALAKLVNDKCPNIKHLFMWREPLKNILSYNNMINALMTNAFLLNHFLKPKFTKMLQKVVTEYEPQNVRDNAKDILEKFDVTEVVTLMWCLHMLAFDKFRKIGNVTFLSIRYEDLLENPRNIMDQVQDHCQLEQLNPIKYLSVMNQDSQVGSAISREKIEKTSKKDFSSEDKIKINHVLNKLNLPPLDQVSGYFQN